MLTESAAAHALAIVTALARRAGGRVRVEFDELGEQGHVDVMIESDATGITAQLVDANDEPAVATQEEAAAAAERARQIERRLDTLMIGAAQLRGGMRFKD